MSSPDAARPTPNPQSSWLPGRNLRFTLLELAAGLFLLGELAALVLYTDKLSAVSAAVLWLQWLCTVAGLRAAGFFTLFGPVLFYEMVRTARRTRYTVIRCLYAGLLMLMLTWLAFIWYIENPHATGHIAARQMSIFAETFFYVFAVIQGLAVVILTPAYTGGAIADEKDRKTLEFILTTDLSKREIVFGKLMSRLANLTMLLLTGLPILSFLQFLGGVDPNLVLATFIATFATMASLAGVSMFFSIHLRKSRDAIAMTYVTYAGYLGLSTILWGLMTFGGMGAWTGFPTNVLVWLGINVESPLTLGDVVMWFNSGNIITGVLQAIMAAGGRGAGGPLHQMLPDLVRGYVVFHGILAIILPLYATARLRVIALREAQGSGRKRSAFGRFTRPRVGWFPMIWKEIFAEPGMRLNWMGRIIIAVIFLSTFLPAGLIIEYFLERVPAQSLLEVPAELAIRWYEGEVHVANGLMGNNFNPSNWNGRWNGRWNDPYWNLSQGMMIWLRVVGSGVASLLLLAVAVRAAGSVSGEREKHTLDDLLTTPLSSTSIVFAKWLGSILSVRWGWAWLASMWLLAIMTGSLSVFAIPFIIACWLLYAAVAAGVGLCYSSWCRKTLSATIWTLATLLFVGGLHWLLAAVLIYLPLELMGARGNDLRWISRLEAGQTPPFVMGFFSFWAGDFERHYPGYDNEQFEFTASCVIGLFVWGVAAVLLYLLATSLFAGLANRAPFLTTASPRPRPRRAPPPRPRKVEVIPEVIPVDEREGVPDAILLPEDGS